jgi:predicted acyl esterase
VTGDLVCGPETLDEAQLAKNRCDFGEEIRSQPLDGPYFHERSPDWSKVDVPMLTAANWGGQGLHLRGNFEGYYRAASKHKWLEAHGLEHWTEFYTAYGVALQRRFFDHFLKGVDNGWQKEPRVRLKVRHLDHFEERTESDWPLPRTRWTSLHLAPASGDGPGTLAQIAACRSNMLSQACQRERLLALNQSAVRAWKTTSNHQRVSRGRTISAMARPARAKAHARNH